MLEGGHKETGAGNSDWMVCFEAFRHLLKKWVFDLGAAYTIMYFYNA